SKKQKLDQNMNKKPLFDLLFTIGLRFALPISYGLNMIYFVVLSMVSNQSLIKLFDDFRVKSFDSESVARKMTIQIIFCTQCLFVTVIPSFLWDAMFKVVYKL